MKHGGIANRTEVDIRWIDAEDLTPENISEYLHDVNGILVPGGFGVRGTEGKILAIQYAREKKIPFLGLCLGMQLAIVEFARNVLNFQDAASIELEPDTTHPVIALMPDQEGVTDIGGTLRLGAYPCRIKENTLSLKLYGKKDIFERHRHRYEVNNEYKEQIEKVEEVKNEDVVNRESLTSEFGQQILDGFVGQIIEQCENIGSDKTETDSVVDDNSVNMVENEDAVVFDDEIPSAGDDVEFVSEEPSFDVSVTIDIDDSVEDFNEDGFVGDSEIEIIEKVEEPVVCEAGEVVAEEKPKAKKPAAKKKTTAKKTTKKTTSSKIAKK